MNSFNLISILWILCGPSQLYSFLLFVFLGQHCLKQNLPNTSYRLKLSFLCLSSCQGEESVSLNLTFDQRLRSLELGQAKADTLLHVHAALLYELQAQLRNLSAAVQRTSRSTGCTVNVIRATPPLGMRDSLPPGTHAAHTVASCTLMHP